MKVVNGATRGVKIVKGERWQATVAKIGEVWTISVAPIDGLGTSSQHEFAACDCDRRTCDRPAKGACFRPGATCADWCHGWHAGRALHAAAEFVSAADQGTTRAAGRLSAKWVIRRG